MHPADLTSLWNSPSNLPSPAAWDSLLSAVRGRQQRRRRLFLGILISASFWTALVLTVMAWRWWGGHGAEMRREWSALGLLALQPAAIVQFWVLHFKGTRPPAEAGKDILSGLDTLLRENRRTCWRQKIIATLLLITAASMPLVVNQLQSAGKAGREIQGPFLVGVPVIAGLAILVMLWHFFKVLRPEHRALNEQLAEIREPITTVS